MSGMSGKGKEGSLYYPKGGLTPFMVLKGARPQETVGRS